MKEMFTLVSHLTIQENTNFCAQPDVLAAAILNPNSNNSTAINVVRPKLSTKFWDYNSSANLPAIIQAMNNPALTRFDHPVVVSVPTGSIVDVGMIGILKLGAPSAGATVCPYSGAGSASSFVTFTGSANVLANQDSNIFLPLNVAPKVASIELTAQQYLVSTGTFLKSNKARRDFVMVWVKMPTNICALNSLSTILDPSSNGESTAVNLELESNLAAVSAFMPSSTPFPNGTASGYIIPQSDSFKFVLNYEMTADSCSTQATTVKTIVCVKPPVRRYCEAGQCAQGLDAFIVDFASAAETCNPVI